MSLTLDLDLSPAVVKRMGKEKMSRDAEGWLLDERERQQQVIQGETVVANQSRDRQLMAWAEANGHAVYIGRESRWAKPSRSRSKWFNPYKVDTPDKKRDGTRDEVCDKHIAWLANQPALLADLHELRGKVLICWCKPDRCHGDELKRLAEAAQS